MSADDELGRQLDAFGETLQDRTVEPIEPAAPADVASIPGANPRRRWALVVAAAAVVAVVVGSVLVVGGGGNDVAIAPATLPEVDDPPSATAAAPTTAPTPSTVPATFESDTGLDVRPWEPIVFSGVGSQTVEIPDDPMVALLTGAIDMRHDGDGPFRVTMVLGGPADERFESVVLDTVGPYDGRRGWRLADDESRGALRSIDVVADGDWTLELFSLVRSDEYTRLEYTPGATVSGTGDDVIQPIVSAGPRVQLVAQFDCNGCAGDIEVASIGNGVTVLVDSVANGEPFTATADLSTAPIVLSVRTSSPASPGNWTITLRERSAGTASTEP